MNKLEKLDALFNFAIKKHSGQFRVTNNGVKIGLITHPYGVLLNVFMYFNDSKIKANLDDLISPALAHDLIEDTDTTEEELKPLMSKKALEIVNVLTNTKEKYPNCNKKERLKKYVADIKKFGDEAIFVKICDNIHNLNSCKDAPLELVIKTIYKAEEFYLPLLLESKLSPEFVLIYKEEIKKVNLLILKKSKLVGN